MKILSKLPTPLEKPKIDINVKHSLRSLFLGPVAFVIALKNGECLAHEKTVHIQKGWFSSKRIVARHVLKLDNDGYILDKYLCDKDVPTTGIFRSQGRVFVTQVNGIIREFSLSDFSATVETYYVSYVDCLKPGDVVADDTLILLDAANGDLFTYSLTNGRKQIKVNGLNQPEKVICIENQGQPLYAVCETGAHCISLYDTSWKLYRKIGIEGEEDGQLRSPCCVTATPYGSLIAVDRGNHRISEFNIDGTFVRHVLTKEDGIEYPLDCSYEYPHIWVTVGLDEINLLRYQIMKHE